MKGFACLLPNPVVMADHHHFVAGTRQLFGHPFQTQADAVLGMEPELFDEALHVLVGRGDLDALPDGVVGGDLHDAPGHRILAPGRQRVIVLGANVGVVAVMATAVGAPAVVGDQIGAN